MLPVNSGVGKITSCTALLRYIYIYIDRNNIGCIIMPGYLSIPRQTNERSLELRITRSFSSIGTGATRATLVV